MKNILVVTILAMLCSCTVYKYRKTEKGACEVTMYSWRDVQQGSLKIGKDCTTKGSAESLKTNAAATATLLELLTKLP